MPIPHPDPRYRNNPAGRLWALCEELVKHMLPRPETHTLAEVLAASTGIPYEDVSGLTRLYGRVIQMPDQAKAAFEKVNDGFDPDIWVKWHPNAIEAVINTSIRSSMEVWARFFDERTRDRIQHLADYLARVSPEPILDDGRLEDIRQQVTDLLGDTQAATDLDPVVQQAIIDSCQDILDSLVEYALRGTPAITSAYDEVWGRVIRLRFAIWQAFGHPAVKTLGNVLRLVASALDIAESPALSEVLNPPALPKSTGS